jgi:hypothetical protein
MIPSKMTASGLIWVPVLRTDTEKRIHFPHNYVRNKKKIYNVYVKSIQRNKYDFIKTTLTLGPASKQDHRRAYVQ